MRSAWVWHNADADWQKVANHRITGLFYAANDPPAALRQRLADTRAKGLAAGIFAAWNWGGDFSDPVKMAERLSAIVNQVPGKTGAYPKVQFDNEEHDPDWILATLRRWRQLQPGRDTSWTFEPMQGGWMSPEFVQEIISLKIRVVPQAYTGSMVRFAEDQIRLDVTRRGFPDSLVSLFYDAAQLGLDWDGFAYYLDRLP